MKNRMLAITLALSLMFSLSACGSDDKNEQANEGKSESEKVEDEEKDGTSDETKIENENDEKQVDKVENEKNKSDESADEEEMEKIDETVLLEHEGLKVTALKLGYEPGFEAGYKCLLLLLENNSDENYFIQTDFMAINDEITADSFCSNLSAGQTVEDIIYIKKPLISKIDIKLEAKDDEYNSIKSDLVSIETSKKKEYDRIKPKEGELILDQEGIKIYYVKLNPDAPLTRIFPLYIENNSDKDIEIQTTQTLVNGIRINPLFDVTLPSGTNTLDGVNFIKEYLEEEGIENIEKIEFKFEISEESTYKDILTSDTVQLD